MPPYFGVDTYAAMVNDAMAGYYASGNPPMETTLGNLEAEPIEDSFLGFVRGAYKANGPIFSCMVVRQLVFSAVRFQFQRFQNGRPSEFVNPSNLRLLERPWIGGTTQDLLARMLQDADTAGNSYWTLWRPDLVDSAMGAREELVRLRPDWVQILLRPRMDPRGYGQDGQRKLAQLGWERLGYLYTEGGARSGADPVFLQRDEVAHFAPLTDPEFSYRGMSWITPLVREVMADKLMTEHQMQFFENGATPNLAIIYPIEASYDEVKKFRDLMRAEHEGVENAYKDLHIGQGADVRPVGADLRQIEFETVRAQGETRIAMAARVPPIIAGMSKGLDSATYSNYGQARRAFADLTMHPMWGNASGSMETILPPPNFATRLWYDARDVPFLREDSKDAAEVQAAQAQTIATLTREGFTPESVVNAVLSGDYGLLKHTGRVSVQLYAADGSDAEAPPKPKALPAPKEDQGDTGAFAA